MSGWHASEEARQGAVLCFGGMRTHPCNRTDKSADGATLALLVRLVFVGGGESGRGERGRGGRGAEGNWGMGGGGCGDAGAPIHSRPGLWPGFFSTTSMSVGVCLLRLTFVGEAIDQVSGMKKRHTNQESKTDHDGGCDGPRQNRGGERRPNVLRSAYNVHICPGPDPKVVTGRCICVCFSDGHQESQEACGLEYLLLNIPDKV